MDSETRLSADFFRRDPLTCARDLIGKTLLWHGVGGRVVETEAYAEHGDEACHTFFRPSAREFVAVNPAGTIYTYLNYGVHWLFNILVKDPSGKKNGFVLLRALEPTVGMEVMRRRRARTHARELCSGPGKLTQALGINGDSHGRSIDERPTCGFLDSVVAHPETPIRESDIIEDGRIGISRARDLPWRFLWGRSEHISAPARW